MQLSQIRIVMVEPSHSGNIGAAARAMKNMGLSQLTLVRPKQFPDQVALTRASGADDILAAARVVDSLEEALSDSTVIYGTSARSRHLPWPLMSARASAEKMVSENMPAAVVFGRERTGLTNDELAMCHTHLQIPTNPNFSSLNLSQAIQVVAYEIRVASEGVDSISNPVEDELVAPFDAVNGFHAHFETMLTEIGFLKPDQPKMLSKRLRRLFNRAQLREEEVHILRGIVTGVQKAVASNSTDDKTGKCA